MVNTHIQEIVQRLELLPHPEGGFYREVYRAPLMIDVPTLNRTRPAYTSIYFLLPGNSFSAWHKVASDESWFFHSGCALTIYLMNTLGKVEEHVLGPDTSFQMTIPANTWFAARANQADSYSLVSCTVTPGFEFSDFELGERQQLLNMFGSEHATIITELTRD